MSDCARYGHTPTVEGRPGNFTSYYRCTSCGDWKRRWPPEEHWHSVFEWPPVPSVPMDNG